MPCKITFISRQHFHEFFLSFNIKPPPMTRKCLTILALLAMLFTVIAIVIHRYKIIYGVSLASPMCTRVNKSERRCKQVYVANSDMSAPANSLRLNLAWEPWMLPLIKQHGNNDGVAFDIGAHIGVHTIGMSPHFKHVLAFEPNPPTAEMLRKNTSTLSNVVVVEAAIGDHTGEANFNASPMNCQSKVVDGSDRSLAVPMIKLDDFVEFGIGPVSFIKIDVEGYEIPAFEGMHRILSTDRPAIVFEDHTGRTSRYLASTYGYKIRKINKSNFIAE